MSDPASTTAHEMPKVFGKLRGKKLSYDDNSKTWSCSTFEEIGTELKGHSLHYPCIISVQSTHDRELESGIKDRDDKESLEVFCEDNECATYMTDTLHFPKYLFTDSWSRCNGFAGLSRVGDANRKFT